MRKDNSYPVFRGIELSVNDDGRTHINIFSQAKTYLGRQSSNFTRAPFTYPPYGEFQSVEACYHWLATGKKHFFLKDKHGYAAKVAAEGLSKVPYNDFQLEVARAIYHRFDAHQDDLDMLLSSNLPFTHYYVFNGVVTHQEKHNWIVDVFENLRKNFVLP